MNAVDYLLKPFDKKRVSQAVQKARERIESNTPATKLETLVKMLEAQKPQATSKVLIKSAGRLFLVDQKRHLLCLD